MYTNRETLKELIANRYGPEIVIKIKHLEFLRVKRVRLETSICFLIKCRDSELLPAGVRIKPRRDIPHSEGILRNASVRLLRQLIRNCRYQLDSVQSDLYKVHKKCSEVLSISDFDLCDRVSYNQASRIYDLRTARHIKKFDKLKSRRERTIGQNEHPVKQDTVINLSSQPMDSTTQSVLEKGLNFAVTPKRIPYENVISNIEEVITRNKLPSNDADTLRQDVAVILRKTKPPRPNITTEERQALKALRENTDILVLKADKGNATVVMNSNDYDGKVRSLLNDTLVYKPVTYNPTARVTKRIRALIRDHEDLFTEDEFARLYRPQIVQPPKLYGLPKIHKENAPLRPIVSQINSPTYGLAKHIAKVLQPLVGRSASFVKDSRHFVDIIKSVKVEPDEVMVSFDVESLFTNVPIQDCLEVIERKLGENGLSKEYVSLLKNCLEGNYFVYRGQHYLQIDGVAMGSPVAPVMANIWMEHFENSIDMQAAHVKLWKRYVDDVYCIMKGQRQEVEQFMTHLNSIHPNIRFTYEMEVDRSLAFLDIKVMVRKNGTLGHTVYRKPTHTDRYLNANSHHHPRHLHSVMTSLVNRAYDLCDSEHLNCELTHVQKILRRNGYKNKIRRLTKKESQSDVSRVPAYLPYLKGVTDKIGTVLKKYSIKTVYSPLSKVTNHLRTPKDVIPLQTPGVYKVDCSCGNSYIGQTKRTIAERVKEHIAAVKNRQTYKSAIAEHLLESGPNHWIELHQPQVLSTDRHYYSRIVREAIEIKKHRNFNREDGYRLSTTWNPVINKCKHRHLHVRHSEDVVSVVCRSTGSIEKNHISQHQAGVVTETRTSRRRHRTNTSQPVTTAGAIWPKRRENK